MAGKSKKERIIRMIDTVVKAAVGDDTIQLDVSCGDEELDSLAVAINAFLSKVGERTEENRRMGHELSLAQFCIDSSTIGIFRVDSDGAILYANDEACKSLGYSREELCRLKILDIDPTFSPGKWVQYYQDLCTQGSRIIETVHRRKDGTTFPVEIMATYLEFQGSGFTFSFARDISRRKLTENALHLSEERYRNILDSIEEGYSEVDLAGRFTFVNESEARMLGYLREELLGMNYRQYTSKETAQYLHETFSRVYETGEPALVQGYEIIKKDGIRRIHEMSVKLMKDAPSRPSGFRMVARDVTERRRDEEDLRRNEERYRTILDTMEEGYAEVDLKGTLTFVNNAGCSLMGYDRDELIGMNYKTYSSPETARSMYDIFNRIYLSGEPAFMVDHDIIIKDGSLRKHQAHVALMRDHSGRPIGFRMLVRDVTDRKKVEDAFRESERRYRMVTGNVREAIWTMDFEKHFTYLSPSITGITGYTPEELQSMPFEEQLTPASRELVEKRLTEELGKEVNGKDVDPHRLMTIELELTCKGGGTVWVEVTASFKRDENGRAIEILGVTRNITERRKVEGEKTRLEAQLVQAQKMESIGRLAGGVAHDFNNMLSVILGYAELIKADLTPDDKLFREVQEIEKAALRSRDITRQLLAFSRKQIIAPRPMDLNRLITDTQKTLARLIGEDIDLNFFPGDDLWNIKFDPSQMEQILMNLAVNARDAMPGGGKLTLETTNIRLNEDYCRMHLGFMPGSYVLLAVSDDGMGMDRETLQNAFEPFFTTKETGKGTGLGLATVYGIINQNNGFINVYSEPGQGTTFRIYLPRSTEGLAPLEEASERKVMHGSGNILLVEDDDMVRTMTTDMLETIGYTVQATGSPMEALSLCEGGDATIDLVITDVVMPGMSGRELRDKLGVIRPDIKVLFMSGYTSNVIVHHGVLEAGVNFVQKPFSMNDLAKKVREVMAGR
jgi:two-component system, cell cycle sensor histidine kinase and response regulator CckA